MQKFILIIRFSVSQWKREVYNSQKSDFISKIKYEIWQRICVCRTCNEYVLSKKLFTFYVFKIRKALFLKEDFSQLSQKAMGL